MAIEYKLCERLLPEMTNLDQPLSDAEWAARLARFHTRMSKIRAGYTVREKNTSGTRGEGEFRENLAEFKAWALPKAKAYFVERHGKLDARSDDELILRYFGENYRNLYDDIYKAGYLPFFEAEPIYDRGEKQFVSAKKSPLRFFVEMIAAVQSVHRANARLDRELAMLRVVEALRLHAGIAGQLPDSLQQVKVVPVPIDPLSGEEFHYELKSDTAELISMPREKDKWLRLTYRITLRK
jgi:hypothetical protein